MGREVHHGLDLRSVRERFAHLAHVVSHVGHRARLQSSYSCFFEEVPGSSCLPHLLEASSTSCLDLDWLSVSIDPSLEIKLGNTLAVLLSSVTLCVVVGPKLLLVEVSIVSISPIRVY